MLQSLVQEIEKRLSQYVGKKVTIEDSSSLGGGCINNAVKVTTSQGDSFFLKYNSDSNPLMFQAEANGLKELSKPNSIKVPEVICYNDDHNVSTPYILLEYLASGRREKKFFESFGRQFAQLHKFENKQFGFNENNYIGSTPQINDWMDNWVDFYREKRLGFQVDLAKRKGLWSKDLDKHWDGVSQRLDELIGFPQEPPSILHGDLWSGNYMVGPFGEAVIIDPAVYYGHREADLAMTELFGGFDSTFYSAYQELYPIEKGYQERVQLYKLYHLMNHLNLFGSSYEGSVRSILRRFSKR